MNDSPLVKICGITNPDDMAAAARAGADFLGFIFHERSPRNVTPEAVSEMMVMLKGMDITRIPLCIGVFVDPDPGYVADTLRRAQLQAAQVHRASPEKLRVLHTVTNGSLIPALQPRTAQEVSDFLAALNGDDPLLFPFWLPALLIDAYHPDLAGGTGHRADLDMARAVIRANERVMLAGGLTPDNVAETVRGVNPYAVDVSSGVESAPGKKDHAKVAAFIRNAKG